MSYDSLLLYRCTIQRSSSVLFNILGQADPVTWANHLTDVHCRYYPMVAGKAGERESVFLTDVVSHYIMHMRRCDVLESDRIINIILNGVIIDAGPFNIILDKHRADSIGGHHLELVLKRVGPTAYQDPTA